jgi:hypothetical protein
MTPEEIGKAVDRYLQYLDKEMSIMGILSTFTALSVGGIVTVLSSVNKDSKPWLMTFWSNEGIFLAVGSVMMLFSSLFFYTQRSRLAWAYGQLALTTQNWQIIDEDTEFWLKTADSWHTWQFYRYAFLCLFAGAAEFGLILTHQLKDAGPTTATFRHIELAIPPVLAIICGLFVAVSLSTFPGVNDPYRSLIRIVVGGNKSQSKTVPGKQWKK